MKATVLTHAGIEGPGLLEDILKERGVKYETVDATTQKIPETDVIIAMGGPMSANDSYRWLISELQGIREHVDGGGYFFGTCLGSQLLAKAIGGSVRKAKIREIGSCEVKLTEGGVKDELFAGFGNRLKVFQWHGETFNSLPIGAAVIATGNAMTQAFRYKNAYGLQFHLEATERMVMAWVEAYHNEVEEGPTTTDKVIQGVIENSDYYHGAVNRIFGRFLDTAFRKKE